jgi:ribosome-associated toxin RatA of RatAB toxin-antitoxin module
MAPTLGAALLVAALGPFAPARGVVAVGRAADGRGCHIEVSAIIEAPLEDVRAVVAEFARYSDWFPTMRSSARESQAVYEVSFRLPWPIRNVRERLAVVEEQRGPTTIIHWRQLDGDFARNEGSWTLQSAGASRTAVRYDNVVQFRRWVPAWLIARAEHRVAPQMIEAIEKRANERAQAGRLRAALSR